MRVARSILGVPIMIERVWTGAGEGIKIIYRESQGRENKRRTRAEPCR